jgi:hypothetical protein
MTTQDDGTALLDHVPSGPRDAIVGPGMEWWDPEANDSGSSDNDDASLGLDQSAPEFYDPKIDDKDEVWVTKMRQGRR